MRKSERLRQLELQVVGMQFQIDLMDQYLAAIIEGIDSTKPELDAGKWYIRKPDNNHWQTDTDLVNCILWTKN